MKKGRFQSKYIVSLAKLKENISIRKMRWLAQGLSKAQAEPGVVNRKGKNSALAVLFPPAAWGPLASLSRLLTLSYGTVGNKTHLPLQPEDEFIGS